MFNDSLFHISRKKPLYTGLMQTFFCPHTVTIRYTNESSSSMIRYFVLVFFSVVAFFRRNAYNEHVSHGSLI